MENNHNQTDQGSVEPTPITKTSGSQLDSIALNSAACDPSDASTVSIVNLTNSHLCALRYTDDQAARAFYDRHRPTVFVIDDCDPANPVSYYIYQTPDPTAVLVEGMELYLGDVPIDPDKVEIEGTLTHAPELPAEFFQQAQQSSSSDDIPDQLKRFDQWVLWRYAERDGKTTKQPFQPTGSMAKSNDPATWSSFERARSLSDLAGIAMEGRNTTIRFCDLDTTG